MTSTNKLICKACEKNEAVGVACVPCVPISMPYCGECLKANSHPMSVLIANTACIDGFTNANEFWKKMVMDSLKHQDKTLEWFNAEVAKSIEQLEGYNEEGS